MLQQKLQIDFVQVKKEKDNPIMKQPKLREKKKDEEGKNKKKIKKK